MGRVQSDLSLKRLKIEEAIAGFEWRMLLLEAVASHTVVNGHDTWVN